MKATLSGFSFFIGGTAIARDFAGSPTKIVELERLCNYWCSYVYSGSVCG